MFPESVLSVFEDESPCQAIILKYLGGLENSLLIHLLPSANRTPQTPLSYSTFSPATPTSSSSRRQHRVYRCRYKRYRLGNDKAFDTLFFPEKELLLKILDNFQHKTGQRRPLFSFRSSTVPYVSLGFSRNVSRPFQRSMSCG